MTHPHPFWLVLLGADYSDALRAWQRDRTPEAHCALDVALATYGAGWQRWEATLPAKVRANGHGGSLT